LRVQQIFRAGTVVYNGFRYSWEGSSPRPNELAALLALSRMTILCAPSPPMRDGGDFRNRRRHTAQPDAIHPSGSFRKAFVPKKSPLGNLAKRCARNPHRVNEITRTPARDVYRLHLSAEAALALSQGIAGSAPRVRGKNWRACRLPPRFHSHARGHAVGAGSRS